MTLTLIKHMKKVQDNCLSYDYMMKVKWLLRFPHWTSLVVVVPLTNLSFGFIFETTFFHTTLFLFQESKGKREEKRRERSFCYSKIGGKWGSEDVYREEKKERWVHEVASGLSQWTWWRQVQGPERSKWTWWCHQGPGWNNSI